MVGATLRFRVQAFIPLLPSFLLLLAFAWWWRRFKLIYILTGFLVLLVSAGLYLEMQSPSYLPQTGQISFGYNALTTKTTWMNVWPLSERVYALIHNVITDPWFFVWVWQVVSLTCFVLFDMLGIIFLGMLWVYLRAKVAFARALFFTSTVLALVLFSLLGAFFIKVSYDSYAVGGQMLLNIGWYILPLAGVSLWYGYLFWQKRLRWQKRFWLFIAALLIVSSVLLQLGLKPTVTEAISRQQGAITFNSNEWAALDYIHFHTPKDAVILSNKYTDLTRAVFSGITGRAAYYEYTISLINQLPTASGQVVDHGQVVTELWSTTSPAQFCQVLTSTVATHLVEYSSQPLLVQNPPCLQQEWSSSAQPEKVIIWQIKR
jgi:hypothetical protein